MITHLSEALFLVTVQQGYMHITSDNKEFQPVLIRLSITILCLMKCKRLTAKKCAFKFTHLLSTYIPFLLLDLRRLV